MSSTINIQYVMLTEMDDKLKTKKRTKIFGYLHLESE